MIQENYTDTMEKLHDHIISKVAFVVVKLTLMEAGLNHIWWLLDLTGGWEKVILMPLLQNFI